MAINIVLVEPEIPQNTGNIARTCAATGVNLHLVKPLGFSIDEKSVRRAGLDYWDYLKLTVYESLEDFLEINSGKKMFMATTKGGKWHSDVKYSEGDMILFGKETAGLPKWLLTENEETAVRIPMGKDENLRSLNLSNAVNIILYEGLRQLGYPNLV